MNIDKEMLVKKLKEAILTARRFAALDAIRASDVFEDVLRVQVNNDITYVNNLLEWINDGGMPEAFYKREYSRADAYTETMTDRDRYTPYSMVEVTLTSDTHALFEVLHFISYIVADVARKSNVVVRIAEVVRELDRREAHSSIIGTHIYAEIDASNYEGVIVVASPNSDKPTLRITDANLDLLVSSINYVSGSFVAFSNKLVKVRNVTEAAEVIAHAKLRADEDRERELRIVGISTKLAELIYNNRRSAGGASAQLGTRAGDVAIKRLRDKAEKEAAEDVGKNIVTVLEHIVTERAEAHTFRAWAREENVALKAARDADNKVVMATVVSIINDAIAASTTASRRQHQLNRVIGVIMFVILLTTMIFFNYS